MMTANPHKSFYYVGKVVTFLGPFKIMVIFLFSTNDPHRAVLQYSNLAY